MTLKALMAAANQKSNRFPVTGFTETEIAEALESLRQDVPGLEGLGGKGRALEPRPRAPPGAGAGEPGGPGPADAPRAPDAG